jgi:hypothetical protein
LELGNQKFLTRADSRGHNHAVPIAHDQARPVWCNQMT